MDRTSVRTAPHPPLLVDAPTILHKYTGLKVLTPPDIVADLPTGGVATLVASVFVEVYLLDGGTVHHRKDWKHETFVFRAVI